MSNNTCIHTTNGVRFKQTDGQSILDASIEASYPIKHSCHSGRCKFCKVKLLSGTTKSYRLEALTPQELNDNWILTCARTALTPITIDAGCLTKLATPKVVTMPCSIAKLKFISERLVIVTLQLPIISKFSYLAGQSIKLTTPDDHCGSYSLARHKIDNNTIEIHVHKVADSKLTDYWFNQAKAHNILTLEGPKGAFFLRDDYYQKDLYFIAANTGIAAVNAMLELIITLPKNKKPRSTTVIWQATFPDDFYIDFTSNAKYKAANITIIFTLALATQAVQANKPKQAIKSKSWLGHIGYAHDLLLSLSPDFKTASVYVSGSATLVDAIRPLVISHGLDQQDFYENITP